MCTSCVKSETGIIPSDDGRVWFWAGCTSTRTSKPIYGPAPFLTSIPAIFPAFQYHSNLFSCIRSGDPIKLFLRWWEEMVHVHVDVSVHA